MNKKKLLDLLYEKKQKLNKDIEFNNNRNKYEDSESGRISSKIDETETECYEEFVKFIDDLISKVIE